MVLSSLRFEGALLAVVVVAFLLLAGLVLFRPLVGFLRATSGNLPLAKLVSCLSLLGGVGDNEVFGDGKGLLALP